MASTVLTPHSVPISTRAARLAIVATVSYQLLLIALIFLRPDLAPSWHTISEWAIGPYGWLMSTAFLISALSYAALFLMLRSQVHGILGRFGLGILLICTIGAAGVGIFTTDPMPIHPPLSLRGTLHVIFGSSQLVLLPFAALLINLALIRKNDGWQPARRVLILTAGLPLFGFLCFALYTAIFVAPLGPGAYGPGVNIGWPPRFAFFTYMVWVMTLAYEAIKCARRAKMTKREKQFSTTARSQISKEAAWFAIFTNVAAVLLLAALHILSPEFSPSWRMISEYALGHYGWVLSLMFLCSGVSCWALVLAIHSEIRTHAGKLGLLFLFISGTGGVLAAFFDVNRPVGHGIAGLLGVIGFPIAALLLLSRNEVWRPNRKGLVWLANLSWISVVLLIATMAIMIMQLRVANGGHLPQHAPKTLPSGVLPLAGWADRMILLSNWAWVFLAASRLIRVRRNVPEQMKRSVAAHIA